MVEQPAAGPQQPMQLGDVACNLLAAHVLGHADGADRVERPVVDVAVVLDADVHPVGQSGVGHPFAGQGRLLGRERDADDVGPVALGGVQGKAAPAAAHVEYPHAGLQPELAADQVDFGLLGGVQAVWLLFPSAWWSQTAQE